jgi:hypothetical protein
MSRARARLFDLAALVRRSDDTAVILQQRGHGEGVALVREARLNYLEDRMAQTDKVPEKAFTLAGSMSTDLSEAELVALMKDLRHAWSPGRPAATPRRRK